MKELIFKNKAILIFLLKCLLLGGIYFLFYAEILVPVIHLDDIIINNLIFLSNILLHLLGYDTFMQTGMIGIAGTSGLIVSPVCDALDLMALFSIFVICFPGKTKNKLWFIPLGIAIIHFMNVIRITLLALIEKHAPEKLAFNHSYTFTLAVYLVIFLMWMWWIKIQKPEAGSRKPLQK